MRRPLALIIAATVLLAGGVTGITGELLAPAAAVDTDVPPGSAARLALGTKTAKDLELVAGRLWVSSGPLRVYTTGGTLVTTVSGVSAADSLASDPAGSRVYVGRSSGSSIQSVHTATQTLSDTWSTLACPHGLSATATTVYYIFGCGISTGVAMLDVATGTSTQLLASEVYGPQSTDVAGTTLAVRNESGVRTFDVAGAAPVEIGSLGGLGNSDLAVSPQGTTLLLGSTYGVDRYAVSGTPLPRQGTSRAEPYLQAVTWSADGTKFAAAMSTGTDLVEVFDAAGTAVSHSVPPAGAPYGFSVVPGTLVFSSSGDAVFVLVRDDATSLYHVAKAATSPGKASRLGFSATSPKTYGKKLRLVATTPGCSTCRVRFDIEDAVRGRHSYTRTAVAGRISLDVTVSGNGWAQATLLPDLWHVSVTQARSFRVPVGFTFRPKGSYKVRSGVLHYKKSATPKLVVQALPHRTVEYRARLQLKKSSGWKTVATQQFTTSSTGKDQLYFTLPRHKKFRVAVKFTSDGTNASSKTYYSKPFVRD